MRERIDGHRSVGIVAALLGLVLCACSTRSGMTPNRGSNSGSALPSPMAGGAGAGAVDTLGQADTDSSSLLPSPTQPSAGSGGATGETTKPADGCVGTSMTAPPPANPKVDIVWVVDASGSMLDEQMKIGANLTEFADAITQSNIDVHIVMLTTSAAIPVICPETPPDPLAGSALASDPRYKFIDSFVDSHNPLDVARDSFPMYSSFLRPDASLNFVIVSDDESTYAGQPTPEARAQQFQSDMQALAGKSFTLHTISSEGPTPCSDPNCMPDESTGICVFVMLGCGAAAPGATYYALADMTQGLKASICESDWKAIFEPLTNAVIESAPLPCDYAVPPPPRGESLDPGKVNVHWLAASATGDTLFPKVSDSAACGDNMGWHYDDPADPKQVLLCPRSCEAVAEGGTLSISFGCATVELQ